MNKIRLDREGNSVKVGSHVKVIEIPDDLPKGLPDEDKSAINAQVGNTLIIEGFSENGFAELEFFDDLGNLHTIWINPNCLENIEKT